MQKSRKWEWLFGGLKLKQCPQLAAPHVKLSRAMDEQRKHALTVAMATAAAAEVAVAAAHAAAEVVRLTGASQSQHHSYKGDPHLAAVRIQSAFRAYLVSVVVTLALSERKISEFIHGSTSLGTIGVRYFLVTILLSPNLMWGELPYEL